MKKNNERLKLKKTKWSQFFYFVSILTKIWSFFCLADRWPLQSHIGQIHLYNIFYKAFYQ